MDAIFWAKVLGYTVRFVLGALAGVALACADGIYPVGTGPTCILIGAGLLGGVLAAVLGDRFWDWIRGGSVE